MSGQACVLTLGDLLLVMAYIGQLYDPLRTIGKKVSSLQGYFASAERAFSMLDQQPDVVERPDARPLARARGYVAFENVSFAYRDGEPVLHNISFRVPAGARVGIAGRTGAGKTTLVLFSTSIAENIAYSRPGASQEDIVRAAKLANAHDFITAFPEGYQTHVGERGMRLSGGEHQRISLARAFLKDASILLLDEPTSSVDIKTEAAIMEAMERLMKGRTTFIIAHRLSTLENCDIRLELEAGRLTNAGNSCSMVLSANSQGGGS